MATYPQPGEAESASAHARPRAEPLIGTGPPGPARSATAGRGAASGAVWAAYAEAYAARYGVPPVRNARVNGQLAQLVARLGAAEAPAVAAWYVGHSGAYYVRRGHRVGDLLADAEKLRTEWATGRVVTETQARQADRRATTAQWAAELLAEARARDPGGPHEST